jgi:hypothetical protein
MEHMYVANMIEMTVVIGFSPVPIGRGRSAALKPWTMTQISNLISHTAKILAALSGGRKDHLQTHTLPKLLPTYRLDPPGLCSASARVARAILGAFWKMSWQWCNIARVQKDKPGCGSEAVEQRQAGSPFGLCEWHCWAAVVCVLFSGVSTVPSYFVELF